MSKLQELIEKRAKIIMDAQKFVDEAANFGPEEEERHGKMMAEASAMQKHIEAMKKSREEAARLNDVQAFQAGRHDVPGSHDDAAIRAAQYPKIFDKFLRGGMADLDRDEISILKAGFLKSPQASMNSGTAANGGYTVPTGFISDMDVALKSYIGVIEAGAHVFTTDSGESLPWPTANDTGNAGRIITEGGVTNVVDPAFGQVVLGSYIYTSDVIKVSLQLVQDSGVDLMAFINEVAAERVGRIQNSHFTNGTGTGQPKGVVAAATLGKTAASATAITFDELADLKFSVDRAYRDAPKSAFMVSDSTLGYITKMKDGENRPLLLPSTREGEVDRILNKPVYTNTDMAAIATGAKTVLFGDFSKYKVRNISGDFLARVDQPYITNFEVAFIYFRRTDANLVDAGTRPIKYLAQA